MSLKQQQLQADLEEQKERIKAAKKDYKKTKLAHKQEKYMSRLVEGRTLFQRMGRFANNRLLSFYSLFEGKADTLRYKQSNPEGFEADELVDEGMKLLKRIEKRKVKGKDPSEKSLVGLTELSIALKVVAMKELGRKWRDAQVLYERIDRIAPPTKEQQAAALILAGQLC